MAALAHRERGRLRPALAQCAAARLVARATAPQLRFQADLETSLGLPFRAARTAFEAAAAAPDDAAARLDAARRLWGVSFFRSAGSEARAASRLDPSSDEARTLMALCRSFVGDAPARLAEPRAVVEPRLELGAVVGALAAGRGLKTGFSLRPGSAHARAAAAWFAPFRAHAVVRLYRRAALDGLSAVGAQRLLLSSAGSDPRRAALLEALREFGERSRFPRFLETRRRYYDGVLARVDAEAARLGYAARFVEYTGLVPAARCETVIAPLQAEDGSARLNHLGSPGPDGRYRILMTLNPSGLEDGVERFDCEPSAWSLWHELGHAATDHWLEGRDAELDRSRAALTPAAARRYASWEQVLREHLVQGLASRMTVWAGVPRRVGEGGRDASLPYLPAVIAALAAYERGRRRFRSLERYYPILLALFIKLAARAPGGTTEGRAPRSQRDGLA